MGCGMKTMRFVMVVINIFFFVSWSHIYLLVVTSTYTNCLVNWSCITGCWYLCHGWSIIAKDSKDLSNRYDFGIEWMRFSFRLLSDANVENGFSYLKVVAIVVIVLGGILVIIGFLGCCGAMKQVKLFLILVSLKKVFDKLLKTYSVISVRNHYRIDHNFRSGDNDLFYCLSIQIWRTDQT